MDSYDIDTPLPLPSATVVLARKGQRAPEVFLVHRHARTSFGASYVFPGGLLEPCDCRAHEFSHDLTPAAADRCLQLTAGGLDYYSAAIRELFEETGALLARDRGSGSFPSSSSDNWPALQTARGQLHNGSLPWPEFLERHELCLACDALHYFAYWTTPRRLAKRFSTRFFLTALPDGQEAHHDGVELTDSRWTTAAAAIDAHKSGELVLPPPTLATLHDVADFGTLQQLLAWAAHRSVNGVEPVFPAIIRSGGKDRVVMPGHADYPPHDDGGES